MAVLSFVPLIVITSIESVGVLLLAREVLIGHKVEEIASDLSPLQRLQFLYAAEDYRGFLIEVQLQRGVHPDKLAGAFNGVESSELEKMVKGEWEGEWANITRGLHRFERYTSLAARRRRRISLVIGTLLILVATWLTFLREHASAPTSSEHHESASANMSPVLSLSRHQLSPFPSGVAEDSSTGLADEVCRLRKAQRSPGPEVAVVIGRHDSRPLTLAAKKRFGSNLGLAQERAETVARLLLDTKTCPDSPPIEAIAISVPNDGSAARSMLDEQRRPDILGLRIVEQTK